MSEKIKRGFALLSAEQRRKIAAKGGRSAQDRGVAHRFSSDEARAAGKISGAISAKDIEHMREIGRRGGKATASKRKPSDM